jgi:hypothetical protein
LSGQKQNSSFQGVGKLNSFGLKQKSWPEKISIFLVRAKPEQLRGLDKNRTVWFRANKDRIVLAKTEQFSQDNSRIFHAKAKTEQFRSGQHWNHSGQGENSAVQVRTILEYFMPRRKQSSSGQDNTRIFQVKA